MMADGSMMNNDMMAGGSDQHFIVQMIPHHEGAIEMAKLALKRSKRAEILALAQGIIEAQEREIAEMTQWHKSWYAADVPPGGMGMHMGGMTGDMELLKTVAEADFDREFMEQMIPHHEMAVMMAQMVRSSEKPEMRELAENVITSQSREIEMMRGWLTAWYPAQ
jgi:uncharacterized protein (DUF305 family)